MVREMKISDARYFLNTWEKTPKLIQDGLFLMGFDDDKFCIAGNLAIYEFRLSQAPDKFSKRFYKC